MSLANNAAAARAGRPVMLAYRREPQKVCLPVVQTGAHFLLARESGPALVTVPRYDAFKDYAAALADQNLTFLEIAGNRGVIVVSLLARLPMPAEPPHDVLLKQPILTEPGVRRYVVQVEVARLADLLRAVGQSGAELEHVYDY